MVHQGVGVKVRVVGSRGRGSRDQGVVGVKGGGGQGDGVMGGDGVKGVCWWGSRGWV